MEKCKKALQRIKELKPYVTQPPFRLELTLKSIYYAGALGHFSRVKRVGWKTILVETENIVDTNYFLTPFFSINNR